MVRKEESELPSERTKSPEVRPRDQDGGWAWVVLVFTCVLQTMGGLVYTTGLFNIMFLEEFGESRQTTAWIGSIQSASKCLYGPLSALIHERLGGRYTVITGTLIGFLGFLLAAFAKNFIWLLFSFGVLLGMGTGISYIAWVMAIGVYFRKYRNLAYGIASACTGIGIILLSPLIQYLSGQFGWRGCVLIMSAIYLHNIAVGIAYVPMEAPPEDDDIEMDVDVTTERRNKPKGYKLQESNWATASIQSLTSIGSRTSSQSQKVHSIRPRSNTNMSLPERHSKSMTGLEAPKRIHGRGEPLLKQIHKQHVHEESESRGETPNKPELKSLQNVRKNWATASVQSLTTYGSNKSLNMRPSSNANASEGDFVISRPRSRANTEASYSPVLNRPNRLQHDGNESLRSQSVQHSKSDLNETSTSRVKTPNQTSKVCRVLKNQRLWVVIFNAVCTYASAQLVFLHFPDLFRLKGSSDSQLAIAMSCIGATSMLCRVLVGMASGSKDIGVLILYLGSGIISGAFIFFTPVLARTFAGQMTFVVFYGFYGNAYNSLMPALTLEVSGLEDLSFAYALVLLMCGVSGAVGPPFGGWLYDITGNFEITFYFAGALCTVGSISLLLIPVLGPRQPKEDAQQDTEDI